MKKSSITNAEIQQRANELHGKIRDWRRTIHRQPELSFNEFETARLVTSVLHDLGIEAKTGVAKTGVVGQIIGNAGSTVGLRADMDALPIQEENDTPFASQVAGVMHACGHDAHTAMLLGAATILKGFANEGRLDGNIRLLFQPSEENNDDEGKSGGLRMVEEGALSGVNAVFGLHVDTTLPTGTVGTKAGAMMAANDMFDLTIRGFGGHGARPQATNDPIVLATQVINAIHHVVSRRINPLEPGVISVCKINAGTAHNIIPDTVKIAGTIRSMSPTTRQLLHGYLRQACAIVEPLGGSYQLDIQRGYPVTINDPVATQMACDTLCDMLGEERVVDKPQIMGSEDFSYMLKEAPGSFLRLGVKKPQWQREYPVHTATFQLDEDALPIGAATLASVAIKWMQDHK